METNESSKLNRTRRSSLSINSARYQARDVLLQEESQKEDEFEDRETDDAQEPGPSMRELQLHRTRQRHRLSMVCAKCLFVLMERFFVLFDLFLYLFVGLFLFFFLLIILFDYLLLLLFVYF
jgi:hypothetical protein